MKKNVDAIDVEKDCPLECTKGLLIYTEDLFDRKKRPVFYNVIRRHDKNDRNIDELEKFIVGNILRGIKRAGMHILIHARIQILMHILIHTLIHILMHILMHILIHILIHTG